MLPEFVFTEFKVFLFCQTMIRRFLIVSLLLLSFLTLLYYVSSYQQELQAEGLDKYLESQAKEIVDTMSPEELTGQVIHVTIPGKTLDETAEKEIEEILPGGIILFGTNIGTKEEISKLNLELQKKSLEVSKLPLLISVDQEGGRVLRVRDGVTQFPGAMALGQTKNADYAYKVGFVTSYQLRKLGFNLFLPPTWISITIRTIRSSILVRWEVLPKWFPPRESDTKKARESEVPFLRSNTFPDTEIRT